MLNSIATLLEQFLDPITVGLITTIGVFVSLIGLSYIAYARYDNGFRTGFLNGFKSKYMIKPEQTSYMIPPPDEYLDDTEQPKNEIPLDNNIKNHGSLTISDAILSQASRRKMRT